MTRSLLVALILMGAGSGVSAQSSGSEPKVDTKFLPAYNSGNMSVGGTSTTTTSGGYNTGGSGQTIPNNTRGSTQDTSYGVGVQYKFK